MKYSLYREEYELDEDDVVMVSDWSYKVTVYGLIGIFLIVFFGLLFMGLWPVCIILAAVGSFAFQGFK